MKNKVKLSSDYNIIYHFPSYQQVNLIFTVLNPLY